MPRNWLMVTTVAVVGLAAAITWRLLRASWRQRRETHRLLARLRLDMRQPGPQLQHLADDLGIRTRLVEVDHPEPFAFCAGCVKPTVVVSTALVELLDDEQLAAVVAHEAHHSRQRDPLRLAILRLTSQLAFILPALRELTEHHALRIELDADREAIDRVGRRPTLEAIEAVLAFAPATAVGNLARFDTLHERVEHLVQDSRPEPAISPSRLLTTIAATILILALVILTSAGGGDVEVSAVLVREGS